MFTKLIISKKADDIRTYLYVSANIIRVVRTYVSADSVRWYSHLRKCEQHSRYSHLQKCECHPMLSASIENVKFDLAYSN